MLGACNCREDGSMKLIGLGRLGRDAELRYTTTGRQVASLSLAYNYGRKDDHQSQWIEASLWGDQAERLVPYLLKGTLVHVILRDVHIETYEGRNGSGAKLVGTVMDIEFAGGKRAEDGQRPTPTQKPAPAQRPQRQASAYDEDDDSIPF